MELAPRGVGWIEVICGSMFSGKTEELIRRLRLARIAKKKVIIFSPACDSRFGTNQIVSHEDRHLPANTVITAEQILQGVDDDTDVVGIDEGQFFDMDLIDVCQTLADRKKRVIVAGLDQDYRGVPFEPIPSLLAVAEFITKKLAICTCCGNPSNRSQRMTPDGRRVMIGAKESYEARCRGCYDRPAKSSFPQPDVKEHNREEAVLDENQELCPLAE